MASPTTAIHPVRLRRKERRLTQAELAQAVGVSRQTIVAVEQGSYAPSVFLALGIGRVLGASAEELFGDDEAVPVARPAGTLVSPTPTHSPDDQEAGQRR